MSAKQESRYRKLIISQGLVATDRQMMMEAIFMDRGTRKPAIKPKNDASRRQVRAWMRNNANDFETATELTEAANAALDFPHGAMDDDGHWVWEEAISALELDAMQ